MELKKLKKFSTSRNLKFLQFLQMFWWKRNCFSFSELINTNVVEDLVQTIKNDLFAALILIETDNQKTRNYNV